MAHRHSFRWSLAFAVAAGLLLGAAALASADGLRDGLLGLALVAVVVPASWIDLDRRLIPNRLTAAGALAAIAIGAATAPQRLPAQLLCGAAAGGFLLVPALIRPDGMGMGDVKLAAVLGLLLGPAAAIALVIALVTATVAGLVLVARAASVTRRSPVARATRRSPVPRRTCHSAAAGDLRDASAAPSAVAAARGATLPFGPFLALGGIVAWFAGEALLAAWFG